MNCGCLFNIYSCYFREQPSMQALRIHMFVGNRVRSGGQEVPKTEVFKNTDSVLVVTIRNQRLSKV